MTLPWHDNDNGIPEADLQAYVDGNLAPRRRAAVEAYLATSPADAARLAAYRAQNIGLHALFEPPQEADRAPLPPEIAALAAQLDRQLHADEPRHEGRQRGQGGGAAARSYRALAASLALICTLGAAGWLALQQSGWHDDPLVAFTRQATTAQASAQQAAMKAPLELASTQAEGGTATQDAAALPAADTPEAAQQVVSWLAAQPGTPPTRLPDLEGLGFELVAQRVVKTGGGQPAAQLLYQNGEGQRVTLLMRAGGSAGKTSFTFTRDGESAQFFWQDSTMAYSLLGKLDQDQLLEIAEAVSRSFKAATEQQGAPGTAPPPADLDSAAQAPEDMPPAPQDDAAEPAAPLPRPEQLEETPKET
jgi:anti-sigma factor RsiW